MQAEMPGVVLAALSGWAMTGALVLNGGVAATAALLRQRAAHPRQPLPSGKAQAGPRPFISVHVPAHDEPADVLIAALDALSQLSYPRFEVIVVDNNTPDPATWRPVEAHCRMLGDRFHFVHRDGVRGAKAGALNIALELSDPLATHVAVVDADYLVAPEFLETAASELSAHGADYVQFPQAYRHSPSAAAVAQELGDYFQAHAPAANATGSMLLTGTLCVIARDQLERAGGWPTATITEDADLGLILFRMGARGVFVNKVVGRGMLPLDVGGLMLQRQRWVAGNMQTLVRGFAPWLWGWRKAGGAAAQLSVLSQLLAWPAFGALPVLGLLAATVLRSMGPPAEPWPIVELLASATLLAIFLTLLVETAVAGRKRSTLAVKLALFWTASLAWIPLLWGSKPRFRRTPKVASGFAALPPDMRWGAVLLGSAAAVLALKGAPVAAIAILLPLVSLPAARHVDRALGAAEPISSRLGKG